MNQWLNKMERKLGRYAIPNLINYVVILYAVGALVCWRAPELYFEYLMLDARAILHGQIWRIVTFLMWPLSGDLFLNVLVIYCYYNLGRTLEAVWGSFRFNVYFFMGNHRPCAGGHPYLCAHRQDLPADGRISEFFLILCLCGHVPGRPVLTVFCDPH